jgi:hypothetical protein
MTRSPSDIVERDDILKDREYLLIGTSTWIDVRTLTVNVQRVEGGLKIDIWPRELLRGYEPIASVEVPFSQGASEAIDD